MSYQQVVGIVGTSGLVFAIVFFVGVLVYALRPRSRRKFEDAATIPFKED